MTENIHPRPILITVRVGGMISPKRKNSEDFQSVHFANENRPKSLKTSCEKNFNRYTFRRFRRVRLCDSPLAFMQAASGVPRPQLASWRRARALWKAPVSEPLPMTLRRNRLLQRHPPG